MSLPAVQTSASPAPPSANYSHDAAAKSAGGAAFAAIISALVGETTPTKAQGASTKDAPTTAGGRGSQGQAAPKSDDPGSIDPDLAGLVLGALPSAAQFAQQVAGVTGQATSAPVSTSAAVSATLAQTALARAPLWGAQTAPATASAPAATAPVVPFTTAGPSTSAADSAAALNALTAPSADPSIAALAAAAAKSTGPSFADAGALEAPQTAAAPVNAAPAIPFSVVQNRTHLGVDSAAQMAAKDPILRAQPAATAAAQTGTAPIGTAQPTPPPMTTQTATTQATTTQAAATPAASAQTSTSAPVLAQSVAALGATAPASTAGKAPSDQRPSINRSAAPTAAAPAPAASGVAASSVAPVAAASSTQNETWSQKRPNHQDSQAAAPAAVNVTGTASGAAALANSAMANGAAVSLGPITIAQLADTLATQASGLASQATPAAAAAAGTASVAGAQPVKELEIQLDPADLGAVSVKMRLSDGKLSVVMEVSKPSTLKAVENDRDAIADRLGSSVQSLESLVIKPSAASQTAADGSTGSEQKSEGRNNAQSDARSSGDSQSGQQSSRRDSSSGEWSRQTPSREPVAGRGFGDMVV